MHKRLPNEVYERVDSTYLVVLIMAQINVMHTDFSNFVWTLNTSTSLVFYIVYLLLPFHLAIIYAIRLQECSDEEEFEKLNKDFLETHGTFIKDFRVHSLGKKATIFLIFYKFMYQLFPVVAIFLFLKTPLWSIILLLLNELISACVLLHFQPYKKTKEFLKALYEKVVLLITIYHLFVFTEWTGKASKRIAGFTIIYFFLGQAAVMALFLILDNSSTACQNKMKAKRLKQKRRIFQEQIRLEKQMNSRQRTKVRVPLVEEVNDLPESPRLLSLEKTTKTVDFSKSKTKKQ